MSSLSSQDGDTASEGEASDDSGESEEESEEESQDQETAGQDHRPQRATVKVCHRIGTRSVWVRFVPADAAPLDISATEIRWLLESGTMSPGGLCERLRGLALSPEVLTRIVSEFTIPSLMQPPTQQRVPPIGPLNAKIEEVSRKLIEGESGVKMTIDIQVVDVRTCRPIANAAGVYGCVLSDPGNGGPNDLSLTNTTTLRGVQFTDNEGMEAFDTVVPGHYAGRTSHPSRKVAPPSAPSTGGRVAQVGRMYLGQKLLDAVERLPPCSANHQAVTKNAQDGLMVTSSSAEADR
ncbi:Intradiol ring-cleavage dioxygenase [Colletotrichum cereale]|nr:Intradiol ring-cleavage dioxygenase [Colletotrichum cereale]